MNYCPRCNKTRDSNITFCPYCGTRLEDYNSYIERHNREEQERLEREKESAKRLADINMREDNMHKMTKACREVNIDFYDIIHLFSKSLSEGNTQDADMLYDIVFTHKTYTYSKMNSMLSEDIDRLDNTISKLSSAAESLKYNLEHHHKLVLEKITKELKDMAYAIKNGGKFLRYVVKKSNVYWADSNSFDIYIYEVKTTVGSYKNNVYWGNSNYVNDFFSAKKMLYGVIHFAERATHIINGVRNKVRGNYELDKILEEISDQKIKKMGVIAHGIDWENKYK